MSVTAITANVLLSDAFLMVMLPVPALTASEKLRTRFMPMATAVASSVGEEVERVGDVVSRDATYS
jgi:hypothetical protein